MVGSHPVVCSTAGLGGDRGGAGTPGGAGPDSGGRTNDSARPSAGADPARQLRRSRSPASRRAANHRPAAGVNRDASLFCSAPDSGLVARHGGGALRRWCDSAVRHTSASGAGPAGRSPRRNRFGRGRSSYRSPPAYGSPRRGTAAPMPPRREMAERQVDLRHDCRDIDPACVPGTVWGTASSLTAKFRSRRRARPSNERQILPASRRRASLRPCRMAGVAQPGTRHHHCVDFSDPKRPGHFRPPGDRRPTIPGRAPSVGLRPPFSARPGKLLTLIVAVTRAIRTLAPNRRGFRQPSTVTAIRANTMAIHLGKQLSDSC